MTKEEHRSPEYTKPESRLAEHLRAEPILSFLPTLLRTFKDADVHLVGGSVRDFFIGRASKDFDFIVSGTSLEPLQDWLGTQGTTSFVGRNFGVIRFLPDGFSPNTHEWIDIALPRTEVVAKDSQGGYKDFSIEPDPNLSVEDDLSRRDFTMNAMAFDLRTQTFIDPFSGAQDLKSRTIRTVGDPKKRFTEDRSRTLRAIRFAAQLGYHIEDATKHALAEEIQKIHDTREKPGSAIEEFITPRETLGSELGKAIHANPAQTIALFDDLSAFPLFFPELTPIRAHTPDYLTPLEALSGASMDVILSVMYRDVPPQSAIREIKSLGLASLSKERAARADLQAIGWLIEKLQSLPDETSIRSLPSNQFETWFLTTRGQLLLTSLRATGHTDIARVVRTRQQEILERWHARPGEPIARLITGNDILQTGVQPGPRVRKLLEQIRTEQLDGALMSRPEALKRLKDLL